MEHKQGGGGVFFCQVFKAVWNIRFQNALFCKANTLRLSQWKIRSQKMNFYEIENII